MMSTFKSFAFIVWLVVLTFSQLSNHSIVEARTKGIQARNKGFTIDLIHRDSPLSPFYNASDTNSNRLRNSILRSQSRINHFHLSSSKPNDIQSDVIPDGVDYLMKFSIGTPPVEILAVADTGSDLIWTQCKPCEQCYPQDAPLFDSQQSSTYKEMTCDSTYCQALVSSGDAHCSGNPNTHCEYSYTYEDRSYTYGSVASETFTFDSTTSQSVSIPNIVFGCGHRNNGIFSSRGSGIFGLGRGAVSPISQLGSEIGAKFSYCLLPRSEKAMSKLNFGDKAIISSAGKVSTPLISKDPRTFYYLTLEGISIGDQRLDMEPTALGDNVGNTVIDSGSTLTYIPADLYNKLESAVRQATNVNPVQDETGSSLCYNTMDDLTIPDVTFHFTGADLKLSKMNTFINRSEGVSCLAIAPSEDVSIFGNVAQVSFQVEYDLEGQTVSFAPADCNKF